MSQEPLSLYNEGYYYYTGTNGYPLNHRKSLEYFQKAAELGVSHAMNYLGLIYESGKVVQQDYKTAAMWFAKAISADQKNAHAAYNMGRMYYAGNGVDKNMEKAYNCFKASVLLGIGNKHSAYSQSCYYTGCILMEHYKNMEEAFSYFVDAAKYGNIPGAWHNMGYITEKSNVAVGKSGNVSKAERDGIAREFYEKAAQLGFAQSMYDVARMCVLYDQKKEAVVWLEKAVEKGYEPAKKFLKTLKWANGGSVFELFK